MKFSTNTFLYLSASLLGLSNVDGHGYVVSSRNDKCKAGSNTGCGNIQYEPQSLEAPKGYPSSGPIDGELASAGIDVFGQLDTQTSSRWHKTSVAAGAQSFTWQFTANHATTGYEYYITQDGWNPDAPLTRAQFESSPFCTVGWDGSRPPMAVTHNCNLPSRSGYHVVMAIWTIDDTVNAFYNMIDVQYGGSPTPPSPTPPTPSPPTPSPPTPSPPTGGTGTCGNGIVGNGICADGSCCSEFGWCDCSAEHCINGQTCGSGPAPAPTPTPPTSGGATCGGGNRGNGVCPDGTCCSEYGWCGCTSDHCSNGQTCSGPPGTCGGGSRGDGICADGTCCSEYGWCGCSGAHCTDGQSCRRLRGSGGVAELFGEQAI